MLGIIHLTGFNSPSDSAIAARYWRLQAAGASFDGRYYCLLSEIQMFASRDATGSDLTTGKVVSASSTSPVYPPPNAIDDSVATFWHSDITGGTQWIDIDFGTPVTVRSLTLTFSQLSNFPQQIHLQYGDTAEGTRTTLTTLTMVNTTSLQTFTSVQ